MSELYKKVNQSVKLLKTIAKTIDEPIELCYSGGKDSDVILALAKMAGINYRAIYKNTTIDPPGTIKHCRDNGVEIVQPKRTFFQLLELYGNPSRFSRFCCGELKEYKIMDNGIQGIRKAESVKRAERYKEPVMCRVYKDRKRVDLILPILEWKDCDVSEFVRIEGIKCHPLYYNDGQFNVRCRVGCIGCVLASQKKRREQFLLYPKMLKAWIKHYDVYYQKQQLKGKGKTIEKFKNSYEVFLFALFFRNMQEFGIKRNLFGESSAKQLLENYFKIDL